MANVKTITDNDNSSEFVLQSPNSGGGEVKAYQYPLTIQGEAHRHPSYLVFYAVEATGGGLSNSSIEARSQASVTGQFKENTLAVIQLYMPNMVENISHDYDQNDGGFMQDLMMNMPDMAGKSGVDKAIGGGTALVKTVADKVSVGLGKVKQDYNAQITGKVLGGRSAAMYKSSAPRQQTFLFQFRPRNLAELKEVGQILKTFLINSAASLEGAASFDQVFGTDIGGVAGGGEGYTVLKVPPLWFIEERLNKSSAALIRYTPKFAFGPAAITNLRINKTPDQMYETFSRTAGDPIAIDLEITLTELRPQFAKYYENLTAGLGRPDSGDFFFGSFGGNK